MKTIYESLEEFLNEKIAYLTGAITFLTLFMILYVLQEFYPLNHDNVLFLSNFMTMALLYLLPQNVEEEEKFDLFWSFIWFILALPISMFITKISLWEKIPLTVENILQNSFYGLLALAIYKITYIWLNREKEDKKHCSRFKLKV